MHLRDQAVVWHPYSQHGLYPHALPVTRASGAYLQLGDGSQVLDAISSWWVNIHGHSNPRIAQAIYRQAQSLEHVIFAGFTHEPATQLAEVLIQATNRRGAGFSKVFFSDNGSTAVEVAIKIAYQFHRNRGDTSRQKFLAFRSSYHGDTFGAMAVSEPEGFHRVFRPLLPPVDFVEPGNLEELEDYLKRHSSTCAAFIFEPIVQGAGGMRMHSAPYLREAIELCRKHGVLTIGDEVFTGFYRTGKGFAFEHIGLAPDLLCLSKGITGGFLPLAVTLATEEIFSSFVSKDMRQALLHGHSYTANPLACAAALESWKLLHELGCQTRIEQISARTRAQVERLRTKKNVKDARCLGTIGAIELESSRTYFNGSSNDWMQRALKRDVLLRPLGNVLYAVPPYCVTDAEVDRIYETMEELIHECDEGV